MTSNKVAVPGSCPSVATPAQQQPHTPHGGPDAVVGAHLPELTREDCAAWIAGRRTPNVVAWLAGAEALVEAWRQRMADRNSGDPAGR